MAAVSAAGVADRKLIAAVIKTAHKKIVKNGDECAAVESNQPQVRSAPVTSEKYLRKMLKFPLTELEARLSAMEAFKNSMAPLLAVVEERFRKLNIDGIPTEVRKCS